MIFEKKKNYGFKKCVWNWTLKKKKKIRKNYQNVFQKKKTKGLTSTCKSGVLIGKLPKKTIYTHKHTYKEIYFILLVSPSYWNK